MAATVTPEAVEKVVFDALPQFGADPTDISRDATFEDLDVDSLDLAELSQIIEDEFGVQLKGCLLYTSPSPRDLSTSRMPSSA